METHAYLKTRKMIYLFFSYAGFAWFCPYLFIHKVVFCFVSFFVLFLLRISTLQDAAMPIHSYQGRAEKGWSMPHMMALIVLSPTLDRNLAAITAVFSWPSNTVLHILLHRRQKRCHESNLYSTPTDLLVLCGRVVQQFGFTICWKCSNDLDCVHVQSLQQQ